MKVQFDRRHDLLYVQYAAAPSVRQERRGDDRVIDYAADGSIVGVEFLAPSRGIDLSGTPQDADVETALTRLGLAIRTRA